MVAPAPAVRDGDDILLDQKFASGMALQSRMFPGQFDRLLRETPDRLRFGVTVIGR